jgi:hypothetical protein
MYFDANPPNRDDDVTFTRGTWTSYQSFLIGFAFCLPIAIIIIGQKTCRKYLSFPYNRRMTKLELDGSFVLGMLESRDAKVNKKFWIHFDRCKPPRLQRLEYEGEHRQFWFEGRIDKVEDGGDVENGDHGDDGDKREEVVIEGRKKFRVALVDSYLRQWYRLTKSNVVLPYEGEDVQWISLGRHTDPNALITRAKEDIRCSELDDLPQSIFSASWRDVNDPPYYSYSRGADGCMIDYFISHSWTDHFKLKFAKLHEVRDTHVKEFGMEPTFWFDKTCVAQSDIGTGLRVLPAHIMACRRFLLICGWTYGSRLWCVW